MPTRSATVPSAGLPPRPVKTDWRWDPYWDRSVVAAKSDWLAIARRLWDEVRIFYPARFDVVECAPIVTKHDGPDEVIGIRFRVAVYPMVYTVDYELPQTGFLSDAFLDKLPLMIDAVHRKVRLLKWRLLEPIQPRCPYDLWWHPDALARRLQALPDIPLGPALYADPR